jgi:TolB protein
MKRHRFFLAAAIVALAGFASSAVAADVAGMLTPRLSSDGEWIAVSYQGAIAKVRRTGGPLVVLTRGGGWDSDPAWSPDGGRIAYVNAPPTRAPAGTLRLLDTRTGAALAVPQAVQAGGPLWFHPDGRRLLARIGPTGTRLGWIDLATGGVTPLAFGEPDARMAHQQWSPYALSDDGSAIFFAVHPDLPGQQTGDNGPQADLFRAPADGRAAQLVMRFTARIYGLSADGRNRGVYAVTDAGAVHNDIWHIPFSPQPLRDARKLTFGQADEEAPTTDAQGSWLVHTDNSGGATRLMRRNTETAITETVSIDRIDFGEPTGTVQIALNDRHDEEAIARVSLERKGGKFHAPAAALYRIAAGLAHFYIRGTAQLELPMGRYVLRAFRGPEYRVHEQEIDVRAGANSTLAVALERWTDPAARGWYSGENHIHANYGFGPWYNTPATIFEQCAGEDLRVANLVVANSDGEPVFDREFFSGGMHPLSTPQRIVYWNQEFRSTLWGHMTLFNLTRLVEPIFTGFRDTTNPFDVPANFDIAAHAHRQGGLASYTHPANNTVDIFRHEYGAKGLAVDVALGRLDTIDVMGRLYETSTPMWYHVLNCGFRVPAAAGTDCFLNRLHAATPGFGRVYVHLPEGLDYRKWVAGLKAGRSFVSNGPVLEFAAGTAGVGDTVRLDRPTKLRVRGRVESQHPLRSLELVYNGKVVASGAMAANQLSATLDLEFELDRSGWIALRASGPAAEYWHGGRRGAHTNPIYVEIPGRPLDRTASAGYFLAWIDRLERALLERNRLDTERVHVLAHLEQAREVYRGMLVGGGR